MDLFGSDQGHQVNFDQSILRQARYFNGGAGGWLRSAGCQVFGVHRIHGGEVVEILQKDRGLDDLTEATATGFEDGLEVAEDLLGLGGDGGTHHLLGLGMKCDLAGGKEQVADADRLRIRADCFGRFVGVEDGPGFAHGRIVAGQVPEKA